MNIKYYTLAYKYQNGGRNSEPDYAYEVYCLSFNKQDCINMAEKYGITYKEKLGAYEEGFELSEHETIVKEQSDETLLKARLEKIEEEKEKEKKRKEEFTDISSFFDNF